MQKIYLLLIILFCFIGFGFSLLPQELMREKASIASIILFSLPAFIGIIKWLNWKKGLLLIICLGLFALSIETIGLITGFPYSHFEYHLPVGHKLWGLTPWTVFFAWSPFVLGAFALAKKRFDRPIHLLFFSTLLLVVFDLVLDPGAVARGLWAYDQGGIWFGVPLQNFLGWVFSSFIACLVLFWATKKEPLTKQQVLLISSSLFFSLAFWTGATFGYQLYLPALIGVTLLTILSRSSLGSN